MNGKVGNLPRARYSTRQLLMPKPALVLMCMLCPFNNFFLFLWLFQQNPIHPSYHQPGNIQSLGIREFPVMLLVMMVAFFQVQYIVTSDAIIISNFILKTDSILCQSSPRSPSRHDAHCYKDNPHDQTNQHLLAGWSARAGVGHLVTARKGFFLLKEISVHHLRHVEVIFIFPDLKDSPVLQRKAPGEIRLSQSNRSEKWNFLFLLITH